jgi:hypothetical protein
MTVDARARTMQVLRFLRDFDQIRNKPLRHPRQHLGHLICHEFPVGPGCQLCECHLVAQHLEQLRELGAHCGMFAEPTDDRFGGEAGRPLVEHLVREHKEPAPRPRVCRNRSRRIDDDGTVEREPLRLVDVEQT